MPLVSAAPNSHPLIDNRQSDRAMRVRRGAQLMLTEMGFAALAELSLANGRRADLTAIGKDGSIWIIEIKSSAEDLRADNKWRDYEDFCDAFAFATLPDVPQSIFPEEVGFIVADNFGAEIIVQPSEHKKLSAARRKAMMLRIARAASQRLMTAEWAATSDKL
ncbi:MAG: MmcB family DNA repair protein [Pseudomonadota bacterium]